jgi:hypothetical protein
MVALPFSSGVWSDAHAFPVSDESDSNAKRAFAVVSNGLQDLAAELAWPISRARPQGNLHALQAAIFRSGYWLQGAGAAIKTYFAVQNTYLIMRRILQSGSVTHQPQHALMPANPNGP